MSQTVLAELARGVRITGAYSFTWADAATRVRSAPAGPIGEAVHPDLRRQLEGRLYRSFYCTGGLTSRSDVRADAPWDGDPEFVAELDRANRGAGCWEPGWRVRADRGRMRLIERDGVSFLAPTKDCMLDHGGEKVVARLPKALTRMSPGFYLALLDKAPQTSKRTVRLYWNLDFEGAGTFMRAATGILNAHGIPGRFKLANSRAGYVRRDAGVVYLPADEIDRASRAIVQLYDQVSGWLQVGTPALTRELAPGMGMAEDPRDGSSFGQDRCAVIAQGLVSAFSANARTDDERYAHIEHAFKSRGLLVDHPYLREGPARDGAIDFTSWSPFR